MPFYHSVISWLALSIRGLVVSSTLYSRLEGYQKGSESGNASTNSSNWGGEFILHPTTVGSYLRCLRVASGFSREVLGASRELSGSWCHSTGCAIRSTRFLAGYFGHALSCLTPLGFDLRALGSSPSLRHCEGAEAQNAGGIIRLHMPTGGLSTYYLDAACRLGTRKRPSGVLYSVYRSVAFGVESRTSERQGGDVPTCGAGNKLTHTDSTGCGLDSKLSCYLLAYRASMHQGRLFGDSSKGTLYLALPHRGSAFGCWVSSLCPPVETMFDTLTKQGMLL